MRLLPWIVLALLAYLVVAAAGSIGSYVVRKRQTRTHQEPSGTHEWERGRRRNDLTGAREGIHDALVAFVESHDGVEAYVEPRTVVSPLTVVLVDADGAWRRFEINDDRVLRPLVRSHGLRVFDASRVGYPPRMRRPADPG